LRLEIRVDVDHSILLQHIVDIHHHARVQVVQSGVSLQIAYQADHPHEVSRDNTGESSQVDC